MKLLPGDQSGFHPDIPISAPPTHKLLAAWMTLKHAAQGKGLHLRSDKWPTVRKNHLVHEPCCQWCGGTTHLEVHHIKPFHFDPELELVDTPAQLITLCEAPGVNCHLAHGHNDNWKDFNPDIRAMCEARQRASQKRAA